MQVETMAPGFWWTFLLLLIILPVILILILFCRPIKDPADSGAKK